MRRCCAGPFVAIASVEEDLGAELDWSQDVLSHKLKLVLYHLERDGVLERRENRTRVFGIHPLLPDVTSARARLPSPASPATLRVLEYLYDPERPREISILDVSEECGLSPADAFREVQGLTRLELIGQDLVFEASVARGGPRSSMAQAQRWFELSEALFALGDDLDEAPQIELRSAAAELGRRLGRRIPPHEVFALLRALRRLALLRLDKAGPSRYRVRFEPGFIDARDRLRVAQRTATELLVWTDRMLEGRTGRDLRVEVDVQRFLDQNRQLYQSFTSDGVVEACLLLHHLEAWHLSDPPVLFDIAMKVRFDPAKTLADLHPRRAEQQHAHDLSLVHLLREYAVLPPERRDDYVADYFRLGRDELLAAWFQGRKRLLRRPVSAKTEARLLDGLTLAQRAAVTAEDNAVLVIAGPGSGKTHTVVRRIVYMVRARQIRPQEILVLAFNRAAAAELRTRLDRELGARARFVDVRTFHSLALRLTGDDLSDHTKDTDARLEEAMSRATRILRGEDPDAGEQAEDEASAPALDRAAFEDLRRRVLGPVRHVLVDEYQDLDPEQYALLSALVGLDRAGAPEDRTERTVYVVGDDDQALYGFRKASVEFLRRFEHEFGARRICLVENFRSSARIVDAAARFIEANGDRMKTGDDERIRAAPDMPAGDARSLRRFLYAGAEHMAGHIAYAIERRLNGQDEGGSIAVLARHWAALDALRFLLEEKEIPFVLHHRDFHRAAHRRHPAARVIRQLWSQRSAIAESAADYVRTLAQGWRRSPDEPSLAELIAAAEDIDGERLASAQAFGVGPLEPRRLPGPSRAQENLSLWPTGPTGPTGALAPVVAEVRPPSVPPRAGPTLAPITTTELADALLLASRDAVLRGGAAQPDARVHLSTFHGAKGLEFDCVYVLPSARPEGDPAEERRAYYVAMTRARREVVLATMGHARELAREVDAETVDLRGYADRHRAPRVAYLDCTPADVRLGSRELSRAQGTIAGLREGTALDVDDRGERLRLKVRGTLVGELSNAGQDRLAARLPNGATLSARVHEIYHHLVRHPDGTIKRATLVVLPTFIATTR